MPGGRHHIANVVLRIDGDRATGRSSWFHTGKNPEGRAVAVRVFTEREYYEGLSQTLVALVSKSSERPAVG
jgi:hypothetical protein